MSWSRYLSLKTMSHEIQDFLRFEIFFKWIKKDYLHIFNYVRVKMIINWTYLNKLNVRSWKRFSSAFSKLFHEMRSEFNSCFYHMQKNNWDIKRNRIFFQRYVSLSYSQYSPTASEWVQSSWYKKNECKIAYLIFN